MNCQSCKSCDHCSDCGACQTGSPLRPLEGELLGFFAQLPFQPVALDRESGRVVLLAPELETNAASLALRQLQRRGLVSVDPDLPLPNFPYEGYAGWRQGSAALTAKGQDMLDSLEFGEADVE